jgi:hypothetical protein
MHTQLGCGLHAASTKVMHLKNLQLNMKKMKLTGARHIGLAFTSR